MSGALIVYGVMILLFLGLGVLFALGRGQKLIAGWNTVPEKEREKYNAKKLMKTMSRGMFAYAACIVVSTLGTLIKSKTLMYAGFVLFLIASVVIVILSNKAAKR